MRPVTDAGGRSAPCAAVALATLAHATAAVTALLERFGDLLTDALDAAGRGADEEFAVAVAERTRVTAALGPRLETLAVARRVAVRAGAPASDVVAVLRPIDDALRHAQLLHDRVADEVVPTLTLLR